MILPNCDIHLSVLLYNESWKCNCLLAFLCFILILECSKGRWGHVLDWKYSTVHLNSMFIFFFTCILCSCLLAFAAFYY